MSQENMFFSESSLADAVKQGVGGNEDDTKKEETKQEEPKDEKKEESEDTEKEDESKKEGEPDEPGKKDESESDKPEDEPKDDKQVDHIGWLKEKYGIEATDEENLQEILNDFKKAKEDLTSYSTKIQETESKGKEYEEKLEALLNIADPNKVFVDDKIKKLNDIAKEFPDKNQEQIMKLLSSDLSTMSSAEVLALDFLIDNPDFLGSESSLIDKFEGKFDETELMMESASAKKRLKSITDNVKESEGLDLEKMVSDLRASKESQIAASKEAWKPLKEELLKQNEIALGDFNYKIDDEGMRSVSDMVDTLVSNGIKPDKDNVDLIKRVSNGVYIYNNIDKIMAKRDAVTEARIKEKVYKEVDNRKPVSDKKRPEVNKSDQRDKNASDTLLKSFRNY